MMKRDERSRQEERGPDLARREGDLGPDIFCVLARADGHTLVP